jgi:hypothetical protein
LSEDELFNSLGNQGNQGYERTEMKQALHDVVYETPDNADNEFGSFEICGMKYYAETEIGIQVYSVLKQVIKSIQRIRTAYPEKL